MQNIKMVFEHFFKRYDSGDENIQWDKSKLFDAYFYFFGAVFVILFVVVKGFLKEFLEVIRCGLELFD